MKDGGGGAYKFWRCPGGGGGELKILKEEP